MLVVNTKEIFCQNLHQNRVHFPSERNAFVFDPQHGHRDVTGKPAIRVRTVKRTGRLAPFRLSRATRVSRRPERLAFSLLGVIVKGL